MTDNTQGQVTYRRVKDDNKPEYWVAERNGKVIARAMSEQGVRSIILTIANKGRLE